MDEIEKFFEEIFLGGISYNVLDAIHEIAKNKKSEACLAFERWYHENVGDD